MKIAKAAEAKGMTPLAFCNMLSEHFKVCTMHTSYRSRSRYASCGRLGAPLEAKRRLALQSRWIVWSDVVLHVYARSCVLIDGTIPSVTK